MKKTTLTRSFFYSIGQITQGLLLHPYQTMQSLVREKVFIWMTLLPTFVLGLVTVVWRVIIVPVVQLIFSCEGGSVGWLGWVVREVLQKPEWLVVSASESCRALPFISNWLVFFCIYWQIMLLYLLFRFGSVFREQA